MIKTSNRLKHIDEYYFSKKIKEIDDLNREGKNIINLGIGSPDIPPHPDVINALSDNAKKNNVHGYQSYRGSPLLRKAFSDWYLASYSVKLDPENEILPLMGSKEGIVHLSMSFLNKGDQVLIPNPGYPTYRSAALLAEAECILYDLSEDNNWFPDFSKLNSIDLSRVKMMWMNYPNMPTGQLPTKKLFNEAVEFGIKNNILICHDNPYSFILNDNPLSIFETSNALDTAVELNSLSKSHNMAGWRIGMLAANKDIINSVIKFKSNMDSGMFLPIQLAAVKALSLPQQWYKSVNSVYMERRFKVFELLNLLNCTYNQNQAGLFMWAKLKNSCLKQKQEQAIDDQTTDAFCYSDELLYNTGVFITPGGIFGSAGSEYIRISLCSPVSRFDEAISRIKEYI